jgi:hypothetical protein
MPHVVVNRPYEFVPPHAGDAWPSFIQWFELYSLHLRSQEGIVDRECRRVELLRESLDAGHGILLCPNHARTADPLVMGWLAKAAGTHVFAMASWHLFNEGWFQTFAIRRMGAFSVYREGIDRRSLDTAVDVVAEAKRPLIVFPEGATSRTNDHLHPLLDGFGFIARAAAKRREKAGGGKVVIHPVGIKYRYRGDILRACRETLDELERRLGWQSRGHLDPLSRLVEFQQVFLSLKELEYLGAAHGGSREQRIDLLVEGILRPLETQWLGEPQQGAFPQRIRGVRSRIVPRMIEQTTAARKRAKRGIEAEEAERCSQQLEALHIAQQLLGYPSDYLVSSPTIDRVLETLEKLEEDMVGRARVHGDLKAIIEVAPAIPVPTERDRGAKEDAVMAALETNLRELLQRLASESPSFAP